MLLWILIIGINKLGKILRKCVLELGKLKWNDFYSVRISVFFCESYF